MRVQHYLIAGRVTVENDLFWTVLRVLAKQLPLKVKTLPFKVAPEEYHLYWHANADQDPANVWMRKKIGKNWKRFKEKKHLYLSSDSER